jgi:ABC-2 type transport system permease protein
VSRTFFAIAGFEFRYYLRRISTWVYFAVFFAISFLLMLLIGGAFASVSMAIGGSGGNVFINSPRSLLVQVLVVSLFGVIVTAALLGNAVYRDFESRIHPLFFTTPVSRLDYLGGRFTGALIVNAIIFLAIPLGLLAATVMPFLDQARVGPIRFAAYFQPYLIGVLPNLLLTGAIFFTLAALTRQMLANYFGGVVLLVGYLMAASIDDLNNRVWGAIFDPFGSAMADYFTRYWTPAEQNTLLLPLEGVVLWNRLLWVAVAVAVLALGFWRFRFAHAPGARRERTRVEAELPVEKTQLVAVPAARREFGANAHLHQYLTIVESSFKGVILNRYFFAILGAGLIFLIFAAGQVGRFYGTTTWPVTYSVLELLGGLFQIFVLIIISFYAGELVWRERDTRIDQVVDAAPIPNWVPYAARLTGLLAIVVMLQAVLLATGVATQAFKGYYDFELGQYVQTLFGFNLLDYALLCVLVMLVHVLVNHKYFGHLIVVLYFVATVFAAEWGLEHNLFHYGSDSGLTYSDMNGYGPFVTPFLWFKAYWAAWAILLATASNLLWVRGSETGLRWRFQLARRRFSRPALVASLLGLVLILGLGGFIFYNTNILNEYTTSYAEERSVAQYERLYKRFEGAPQPRIVAVEIAADLFPEGRDATVRGVYTLVNQAPGPIDSLHFRIPDLVEARRLEFSPDATPLIEDDDHGYYVYRLAEPLMPGDSLTFDFEVAFVTEGFENSVANLRVVENGTFLSSEMMPRFGYSANLELSDNETRRKHDLQPKDRLPPARDLGARMNNPLAGDADWIDFRATISTSPDQIALAPGYLEREWEEDGRRYFQYSMDSPMLAFFSVLSGRYEVRRDRWGEVAIEVFYHPGHEYNVDRMVEGVKRSLDYYTAVFGPYQHRQVRIVEFPRYQTFAQSFPNTIPYSEGIGFIARVEDPLTDIDYPFYVTAHEVAHQWWGHQTIGGDVQGSTLLIETLSQYSALMVMEKEFGPDQIKRFLEYELDSYLTGRAFEREREMPLLRVEDQGYIHYNKGAVVMYALRDYIGEEQVNSALRAFLEVTRFQQPPYTTALELYQHLQAATPDSLSYLLRDMFEEITLYENRASEATSDRLPDGRHRVRIDVVGVKLQADSLGNESPVAMRDLVEIGVFGVAERGEGDGAVLYLSKHRIVDGEQTIEVIVDAVPATAGIDPMHKLIDRNSSDNVVPVRAGAS